MTEFGIDVARGYWRKIIASTPIFLSINHEANAYTVSQIAADAPAPLMEKERYPYGVRKGYAQEVFRFPQNRAPTAGSS
ncbi:hypothetical protein [Labrys miyagiensis]|nr:hypothetical protein [Labrys miyagiensis]